MRQKRIKIDLRQIGGSALTSEKPVPERPYQEIASFFLKADKFVVRIDDFKPTANIYAMGVESCDPAIRPEDEVVVAFGDEVRGVGIAKMPAIAMKQLKKGLAVKMRN